MTVTAHINTGAIPIPLSRARIRDTGIARTNVVPIEVHDHQGTTNGRRDDRTKFIFDHDLPLDIPDRSRLEEW